MKKMTFLFFAVALLFSCTSLTYQERQTIKSLNVNGISLNNPAGNWERPANPAAASLLNLLPGIGNFYLASGNGGDGNHYLYGTLNLLTWPISILWGIPEGAIDANTINQKELVYYYTFDENGQQALKDKGLVLDNRGVVSKINKSK